MDTTAQDYFEQATALCLQDLNFDGYNDFNAFTIGSNGTMSDYTEVWLYDSRKQSFELSDTLSVNRIVLLDRKKRLLCSRNEYRYGEDSIATYFDRKGKIKSTEVYSHYTIKGDTTLWQHSSYTKTVGGKVILRQHDSVPLNWE